MGLDWTGWTGSLNHLTIRAPQGGANNNNNNNDDNNNLVLLLLSSCQHSTLVKYLLFVLMPPQDYISKE